MRIKFGQSLLDYNNKPWVFISTVVHPATQESFIKLQELGVEDNFYIVPKDTFTKFFMPILTESYLEKIMQLNAAYMKPISEEDLAHVPECELLE
jgi:hypothetical protein